MLKEQDYENIEHIICGVDGIKIGEKRNICCERAKGEIIIHCDDDDIYAPDWISKSVAALVESKSDLVGLSSAYFTSYGAKYLYTAPKGQPYVVGATFCYWRSTWERNKFRPIQVGEDMHFCASAGKVKSHDYIDGFTATIHSGNTASNEKLNAKEFVRVK